VRLRRVLHEMLAGRRFWAVHGCFSSGRKTAPKKAQGLKSLRENDHHEIESRRDGLNLLNLAQDAVLGWDARWKSPAGTTGSFVERFSWILERTGNSHSPEYLIGSAWDCLRVSFSRPYGTFRLSHLHPGPRPGLSSAVPAGLILQSVGSHAHTLKPSSLLGLLRPD
jgi:hypothetical protein